MKATKSKFKHLEYFFIRGEDRPHMTKKQLRTVDPKAYDIVYKLEQTGRHWVEAFYSLVYPNEGFCFACSNRATFYGALYGYSKFCGTACSNADASKKALSAATCIERYGATTVLGTEEGMKHFRKTMKKRYGAESSIHCPAIREKQLETMERNYGTRNLGLVKLEQRVAAWNVNEPAHSAKRKATMVERYGVEHSMQVRDVHERQQKSAYRLRPVKVVNKTFLVQGYEDLVIRHLATRHKLKAADVIVSGSSMPSVPWVDAKGISHVYHPDLYIRIKNRWWLVEVKSDYTAGITRRNGMFPTLKRKIAACVAEGYNVVTAIVTAKHDITLIPNLHLKTKADIRLLVYGQAQTHQQPNH